MTKQVTNLTADGQSATLTVPNGGQVLVTASGTWGSGSLVLQVSDGTNWINLHTALTADGSATVDLPRGESYSVRVNLSGSTSPDLDVLVASEEV
jgi:hypothetical protein